MSKGDILDITISITTDKGEKYVGTAKLTKTSKKILSGLRKKSKLVKAPTATSAIRVLYQNGFFKTKRKLPNIKSILTSKGMNFVGGHVSQALDRSSYLRREGKRGKFTYIQKYPPN